MAKKKLICHWCGDDLHDHTPQRLWDCYRRYDEMVAAKGLRTRTVELDDKTLDKVKKLAKGL